MVQVWDRGPVSAPTAGRATRVTRRSTCQAAAAKSRAFASAYEAAVTTGAERFHPEVASSSVFQRCIGVVS